MERWAKTLNRHKENMRSASSSTAAGSTDRRESASADAGYAVLEKKVLHAYTYLICWTKP